MSASRDPRLRDPATTEFAPTGEAFTFECDGDLTVITATEAIEGIDFTVADEVTELILNPLKRQESPLIVFDLSRVEYFGSTFLAFLIRCSRLANSQGGSMALSGVSDRARELLRVTALDPVWPIYDSRREAMDALRHSTMPENAGRHDIVRESDTLAVDLGEAGEIAQRPSNTSSQAAREPRSFQSAPASGVVGRLRMSESYKGVVEEVDGDRVLVVYDVDGKIVEQIYEKSQFIGGRLPEVGTQLAVFVTVAEVHPRGGDLEPEVGGPEPGDEPASTRRQPLSGTVEF